VRGKDIDFSPQAINDLLDIVPLEQCDVKRRRETCESSDDETWEEVKSLLCVEGAQWQGSRRMLLKSDFKPVAKAWASFVVQILEGTSCSYEIPLARVHTIAAIMDGGPINVGELIANNIADFAAGNKKAIPHMSLINWLYEVEDCEIYVNDIETKMMKPLTDTYMEAFLKDYLERMQQLGAEEEASPQPQPQQPPPQPQFVQGEGSSQPGAHAPIHPMMLEYMFGHCNWMNEVSDQEYWNRPRFGPELTEAVCLNRRAITGSFDRFDGSEEAMDKYFDVTRSRAQVREQEIRADFAAGGARSRYHFGEDSYEEQNPSTWIDPDLMRD